MESYYYDGSSIQNRRATNMDSVLIKERRIDGRSVCLAVVCDGVGSLADGAYAASSAVQLLSEWMDQLRDTQRLGLRLRDRVLEINRSIVRSARDSGVQTASTLSALLLLDGRYYVVHAGDSRIYLWQDGALRQLTMDQTASGRLTACIGRQETVPLLYNEGAEDGARFLLCSDGLYRRMDADFLQRELARLSRKNLRKTMERLMRFALERGETDNVSLALVICEKGR